MQQRQEHLSAVMAVLAQREAAVAAMERSGAAAMSVCCVGRSRMAGCGADYGAGSGVVTAVRCSCPGMLRVLRAFVS
jgi:hypothetical protein